MIYHIVLIRLKPEVNDRARDAFMKKAEQILGPIPGVRNLRVGSGLGLKAEREHPVALFMEFDDEATLAGYQVHPEHERFVSDVVGPIQEDKKVYDYFV